MMSNCAFWSTSGELAALHGDQGTHPVETFARWAQEQRLPPGRLVRLSRALESPFPVLPGWQSLDPSIRRRRNQPFSDSAPVAAFAPVYDTAARLFLPQESLTSGYVLRAEPTWVLSSQLTDGETTQGWWEASSADGGRICLVRVLQFRGRLASPGWQNLLIHALRIQTGARVAPLSSLPSGSDLALLPAWQYRVEAGTLEEQAAWDVEIFPSPQWLSAQTQGLRNPWEATAWLRWIRPQASGLPRIEGVVSGTVAGLLARLPVRDARLLVQNVLTTLPGGVAETAQLFFEAVPLPPAVDGRQRVRYVALPEFPLTLATTLFGPQAWAEVERARRFLPGDSQRKQALQAVLADIDLRLAEGRLLWSNEALELWQLWYRDPRHRSQEKRLETLRSSGLLEQLWTGSPLIAEELLRRLDVTDIALCLKDLTDKRWRHFVSARREKEIRDEQEFCKIWIARGELTLERELDAWQSWQNLWEELRPEPRFDPRSGQRLD